MTTRVPMVAGNWKLNHTLADAKQLVSTLAAEAPDRSQCEVVVAPPATALKTVVDTALGSAVAVAAQNVYHEKSGAFTGENSPALIRDVGCSHCIVGHSERRQLFSETDAAVHQKVVSLLEHQLIPIVCVGETLAQRDEGTTVSVVLGQTEAALKGLSDDQLADVVIAYEPVWAIGTGRTASPQDAQDVHAAIRGFLSKDFGASVAESTRILYGGSVKPNNAKELLAEPDIDGALVGGASLKSESFLPIVQAAF